MKSFRLLSTLVISLLLLGNSGNAQESSTENSTQSSVETVSADLNLDFHRVPTGDNKTIFQDAVTGHIVSNKGIQDFYTVPAVEVNWLQTIVNTEKEWHEHLKLLEEKYRKAFQRRAELISGQGDRAVRIANYSQNISKLEKGIAEIRRQIVQINVDQQVYINSLRKTSITSLVAIKTLFTEDLLSVKNKLDVLNSTIFSSLEEPVLGHTTKIYAKSISIPFQAGHIRVSYMYPENITIFDSEANEHVYLFLRVEAYPFSTGTSNDDVVDPRGVSVQVLSSIEQILSYLKTKNVGDKRLQDWLKKEYNYQIISNEHLLDTIRGKLAEFKMFREGLKLSITDLTSKVQKLEAKRNSLIGSGDADRIEAEYKLSKNKYHQYYINRKVLTHEKYTLENDVMFSLFSIEGESNKNNGKSNNKQMVDSTVAANIPISGRPLKDIFSDILFTANQKRNLNLQNYRVRIYSANEEQTQLIQGVLDWEIVNEDFSILKLTRGNVGSRSHFVLHLAKQINLSSKPGFPAPKSGVCESTLLFKRGKNVIRNSSKPALKELAKCLRKFPNS